MWGIDVSHHQGTINWQQVANQGIQFVIMKAMYETSHRIDENFEFNYHQSGLNKLIRGTYIYVIAKTPEQAKQEALDFLSIINNRVLERGIWLDMEDKSIRGLGRSALGEIIKIEANIFRSAGYKVGIYCNKDWYFNVLDGEHLSADYLFWIARYPLLDNGHIKLSLVPGYSAIYQYSSKGKVDGITGNVDMNYDTCDLDLKNDTIAEEVMYGEWGNDVVRKNRLEAAGYDYKQIQQIVTAKMHESQYYPAYTGNSYKIDEVFRSIGVPSVYIGYKVLREPVAIANGIKGYTGTLPQNLELVRLAKEGKLKKPKR